MATLKQTIANRLNALKSTGPRTDAGKARSARNATKHGLSRLGATPPASLADAIADRKDRWRSEYRPEGPAQEWHFERLCAESVRLDACERRILAARAELADRAAESWDDDRAADVAELASKLAGRPEVIQPKLLRSRHGVLWLLERWDEVADSLARHDGWTPATWARAMDLLGLPADAREGSGPWDLDAEDKSSAPGLDLVRRGVDALRARLDSHLDARDARARDDAEAGLGPDDSPDLRRLERYAADARRRVSSCLAELRRLQAAAPRTPAAASGPPGPRPARVPRPVPAVPPRTAPDPNATAPPSPAAMPSHEPSRPTVSLSSGLRDRLDHRQAPLNRRERRALAAAARRS